MHDLEVKSIWFEYRDWNEENRDPSGILLIC